MILSFHPCFVADENRICAGRQPDQDDLALIRSADAVILPQGCGRALYEMARDHCGRLFPNYDARFNYPGKLGQARLFGETDVRFPATRAFSDLAAFRAFYANDPLHPKMKFPLVFKFDWGGEGDAVFHLTSKAALEKALDTAATFEHGGHKGFLLQEAIPAGRRSLRVVVIGGYVMSYWRIQQGSENFHTALSKGARIEPDAEPALQKRAVDAVRRFCEKTRINLAGFDLIFAENPTGDPVSADPYFLEINYFFGRQGLGGSTRYYRLLEREIKKWIRLHFT